MGAGGGGGGGGAESAGERKLQTDRQKDKAAEDKSEAEGEITIQTQRKSLMGPRERPESPV